MTLTPRRCNGGMTLLQQEPSAHAPCTKTTDGVLRKHFILQIDFLHCESQYRLPEGTLSWRRLFPRRVSLTRSARYQETAPVRRLSLSKSLCSRGNEERIVLAPNRKQRRFRLAKIFLKFRIELYVRCVIQKQIELNLFVAWAFEQSRVQCVRLRREHSPGLATPCGVLPARSARSQNALAEYVPIFGRGCMPSIFGSDPKLHQGLLRMRCRSAKQSL